MVFTRQSVDHSTEEFDSPPAKRRRLARGKPRIEVQNGEALPQLPPLSAATNIPTELPYTPRMSLCDIPSSSAQPATPPPSTGVTSYNTLRERLIPRIRSQLANREQKIPAWQTLPPHILDDIFMRLANKIKGSEGLGTKENDYLLRIGLLCRAFFDSISSALYYSPGLSTIAAPHQFMDALQRDPARTMCNYRNKVRAIEIEVMDVLRFSYGSRGRFDVANLMPFVPRLQSLELTHNNPSRSEDVNAKLGWSMVAWLFEAIDNAGIELKKWSWDKRMRPTPHNIDSVFYMVEAHLKPAFQKIEDISFVNFNEKPNRAPYIRQDDSPERELAEAIALLPNLKCLSFWSSNLLNSKMLPLLPRSLTEILLQDCNDVHAEDFVVFLLTQGSNIVHMQLDGCQSLSLSFLGKLREACPKLRELYVDMKYKSSVTHASQPGYTSLIGAEQVPTWPSTLECIDLQRIRFWDKPVAQRFLGSLISAAPELPLLRCLKIRGQLSLSAYIERAQMREYWISRMRHVFQRQSAPPDSAFESIALYKQLQEQLMKSTLEQEMDEEVIRTRRSMLARDTDRSPDSIAESSKPHGCGPSEDKKRLTPGFDAKPTHLQKGGERSINGDCPPPAPDAKPSLSTVTRRPPMRLGKIAKYPLALTEGSTALPHGAGNPVSLVKRRTQTPSKDVRSTAKENLPKKYSEDSIDEPRRTRAAAAKDLPSGNGATTRRKSIYNTRSGDRRGSRVNYAELPSSDTESSDEAPGESGSEDEDDRRSSSSDEEIAPSVSASKPVRRSRARSASIDYDESPNKRAWSPVGRVKTRGGLAARTKQSLLNFSADHVQGMCDVVQILLDNGTPAEEQFNEEDFLDSEPSDDEDWNEADPMTEDDHGGF